jgi:hypothetical protein
MLASLFTDFTNDSVTINRVKFHFDATTKALTYNGAKIDTEFTEQNGLQRIEFLDIPKLKRTISILDYYNLRNVYSFKDAALFKNDALSKDSTLSNDPSKFKRPFYYDFKPDIYFTPKSYELLTRTFDDAFASILMMHSAHSYFLKYKEHSINVNIFFADDETGYIIELEYFDHEYIIFREFKKLFEALLEG